MILFAEFPAQINRKKIIKNLILINFHTKSANWNGKKLYVYFESGHFHLTYFFFLDSIDCYIILLPFFFEVFDSFFFPNDALFLYLTSSRISCSELLAMSIYLGTYLSQEYWTD